MQKHFALFGTSLAVQVVIGEFHRKKEKRPAGHNRPDKALCNILRELGSTQEIEQ
jgi:hypothetical protein